MLFKLPSRDPPRHRYAHLLQTTDWCCSGSKLTKRSWRLLKTSHSLSALKTQRASLPKEGDRFPKIMKVFRSDQTFSCEYWTGQEGGWKKLLLILHLSCFQHDSRQVAFAFAVSFAFHGPSINTATQKQRLFLYCIGGVWMGRYMQSWFSTYFFSWPDVRQLWYWWYIMELVLNYPRWYIPLTGLSVGWCKTWDQRHFPSSQITGRVYQPQPRGIHLSK